MGNIESMNIFNVGIIDKFHARKKLKQYIHLTLEVESEKKLYVLIGGNDLNRQLLHINTHYDQVVREFGWFIGACKIQKVLATIQILGCTITFATSTNSIIFY